MELITTIEEFRKVFPTMSADIDIDSLESFIDTSENYLKEEILGTELFDVVVTNKHEDEHAVIAEKCRTIVVLQAVYEGVPFWDLTLETNGFAIVRTNQLAPASPERIKALRDATTDRRDKVIDYLIDYLETTETYQDEWKASPVYEQLSDCLIRTGRELTRFSNKTFSRSAFLEMKPLLISLTKTIIEPIISEVYISELIEKQRDNDIENADKKILDQCKYILGALAVDNKPVAQMLMEQTITYMDKNLTTYTTYAESDEYTTRNTPGYENTDCAIFVSP